MAGTGILQLPFTLNQGGWAAVGIIVLSALGTWYTGIILIDSLHRIKQTQLKTLMDDGASQHSIQAMQKSKKNVSYPDIGEAAFGRAGRYFVHVFHKATLLGVSTLFLILAAKFLLEGIGGGGSEGIFPTQIGSNKIVWTRNWTLIAGAIVAVPVVGLRSFKELPMLTALGVCATVVCVVSVVVCAVLAYPAGTDSPLPLDLPDGFNATRVSHKAIDWNLMPSAFSAIALSFGGHANFPSIESHMHSPEQFPLVLTLAFAALLALYLLTAIVGYWAFGNITASPILCNFPLSGPVGGLGIGAKLLIAFHVLTAYPILMHTFLGEVEEALGIDGDGSDGAKGAHVQCRDEEATGALLTQVQREKERSWWMRYRNAVLRTWLRCGCVLATTAVATFLPYFAPFMTLIGAVCIGMIVWLLPVVFYWRICGGEISCARKALGVIIVVVGLVGGSIGAVQAVNDIVQDFRADYGH